MEEEIRIGGALDRAICWLRGIWRSLVNWRMIEGHNYNEEDKIPGEVIEYVHILRCKDCDNVSVGYKLIDMDERVKKHLDKTFGKNKGVKVKVVRKK